MPVVPTEQNKIGLASVSGAKFEAADLSGTGLQALGSGVQSLGETGQRVAVEQHRVAIADDAAVKAAWNAYSDQARAIRANFYAQRGAAADAALQPSIEALHGAKAALHADLTSQRRRDMFDRAVQGPLGYDVIGFNAYAASAKGVEQDNQSVIAQDGLAHDAVHNADNPAFAAKLLETGSESIKTQAIVQGRDPASVDEKVAKYRSSVHLDVILGPKGHDPLAAHHYLAKNSGDMIEPHKLEAARLLAPALGQLRGVADIDSYPMLRSATEPATPPGDIATVTGRLLDVGAARRTGGDAGSEQVTSAPGVADASATGMLALMQRYRGSAPKSLAASLLGTHAVDALVAKHGKDWFGELPAETYKAVAHDMGMLGAGTSPREALAFEDRTAIAGWIDAQPWDDARKQSAHEELHTRAGLEDRRRTEARDKAKEAAFATIDKLGAGFISVNQLPPAVRRDLGEDAMAALTLRANRNVHPMTVAAHGDVAMDLNRMAATDPETFAKQDLRLRRDEMTPVEYDALGRLQKGIGTYPPAPSAMTQRRALETMQRNGLDVGPRGADVTNQPTAIEGGAPPDAAPERSSQTDEEVDRLANVETIPEALRGADTTKAAIREMLRNDWTPDQIQNQLYEAYARRSLGLSFDDHPGGVGSLPDQGNPEELVPEARFRNIASEQNGQITFDPNGRPVVSPDGASPSDAILGSLFPPPQPVKKRVPSNQLDYGDFSTLWEAERKKGVKLPKFVPAEAWKKFAPDAEKMHPETLARPYDRITLHHTGSEDTPEAVETLHGHEPLWHKLGRKINNPANQEDYDTYGDVGYHFLIGRDGTIYEGRSLAYQGAHVMNQNERNIGIAFLGDYSKRQLKPAQINSTKYLIRELNRAYGVNTNAQGLPYVVTHRELAPSGQFARPDELLGAQKQTDEIEAWSRRFLPPLAKERAWVLQALPPARKSR